MIPIACLFIFSGSMLRGIGQEDDVADNACLFCVLMIPGSWAMCQFDAAKRFATSQLKARLPLYS